MLSNTRKILGTFKMFLRTTIMGEEMPIVSEDRYILEQKIIPYFINLSEFTRILFVGCDVYTKHYEKWFRQKEYWTIEVKPLKKIYGAKRHIVGSISDLKLYFPDNYLDLIICNGVFGWGLNEREEVEKTFAGCFDCLRQGGVLIVGWNDLPERKPFPLEECKSLGKFQPYIFPPLSTSQYDLSQETYKHVYNFYLK